MAFTGSATVEQITDTLFRITGVALAASAAGTIGFTAGTNDVEFTAPNWEPQGGASLQDAISVLINPVGAGASTAVPVRVVKTGTTQADFVITLTNNDGAAATANLEIYVRFN